MKFTSPLKYRKNQKTTITQPFGANPKYYSKYKIPGHNGIDFVNGHQRNCYGIGITATHAGRVTKVIAEEPMSTKGNGVYIQVLKDKKRYKSVYWHLSEVLVRVGDYVKQGQLVGRMGNSGIVRPAPNISKPYQGTHLHYGLYVWEIRDNNWFKVNEDYKGAVDPMPYFSDNTIARNFQEKLERPNLGRLSIILAPIIWAIGILKEELRKMKGRN